MAESIGEVRQFLHGSGPDAVVTAASFEGAVFTAETTLPASIIFTGTSTEVMDRIAALADHFSAAREMILAHLTEG